MKPSWWPVTNGVQGLIVEAILSVIFINDLDAGSVCAFRKFAKTVRSG